MTLFLSKPRYYDAPDGKEPVDKIVSCAKRGFIGGLLIGMGDCLYYTDTKTALQTANCLAYWIVPMVGIGSTFAAVTFASTRLRKKDDAVNYAYGALACSPIIHAWSKCTATTWWSTAILVAFAYTFKDKETAGLKYFPKPRYTYGTFLGDYSMDKDVDKDWKPMYLKSTF